MFFDERGRSLQILKKLIFKVPMIKKNENFAASATNASSWQKFPFFRIEYLKIYLMSKKYVGFQKSKKLLNHSTLLYSVQVLYIVCTFSYSRRVTSFCFLLQKVKNNSFVFKIANFTPFTEHCTCTYVRMPIRQIFI